MAGRSSAPSTSPALDQPFDPRFNPLPGQPAFFRGGSTPGNLTSTTTGRSDNRIAPGSTFCGPDSHLAARRNPCWSRPLMAASTPVWVCSAKRVAASCLFLRLGLERLGGPVERQFRRSQGSSYANFDRHPRAPPPVGRHAAREASSALAVPSAISAYSRIRYRCAARWPVRPLPECRVTGSRIALATGGELIQEGREGPGCGSERCGRDRWPEPPAH